jgi:hypothetical protein
MRRYYRMRVIPEESLFHTALCSQVDLQICKDHNDTKIGQAATQARSGSMYQMHLVRTLRGSSGTQSFLNLLRLGSLQADRRPPARSVLAATHRCDHNPCLIV